MLNLAWDACCLFPTLEFFLKKQFVKLKNSWVIQFAIFMFPNSFMSVSFSEYFDLAKQADFY